MNTITHTLLPVIGIAIARKKSGLLETEYWNRKRICAVALFGALPDLLNPHFSLAARLSSWTHGLPGWLGFVLLLMCLVYIKKLKLDPKLAAWMASAYLFHLFCDMIAGGIAWLYPFHNSVIGMRLVPYQIWIPLDMCCGAIVYFVFRAIPKYRLAKLKAESVKEKQ
jgi:membrane-bound metal-dependent hydrolase YbcI (DUF457 family)